MYNLLWKSSRDCWGKFVKVSEVVVVVGICDDNDEITYWGVRGMRNEIMLITHPHHHHKEC